MPDIKRWCGLGEEERWRAPLSYIWAGKCQPPLKSAWEDRRLSWSRLPRQRRTDRLVSAHWI
jgi:hypothetical protein